MGTQKETVEFILGKLRPRGRFAARAMFGEYALYADDKVVGLVCDDLLYVKIVPASARLAPICEQGHPYPAARPHYIVEEAQLSTLPWLSEILLGVATLLPEKKEKTRRARSRRA